MKHDVFAIVLIFITLLLVSIVIYQCAMQNEPETRRCLIGDEVIDCDDAK